MIPSIGTGFLPFMIATPPLSVPLPVDHVATYASQGGPAPIITPILAPALVARTSSAADADADAEYGIVSNSAYITVVSLRRFGVYSALVVDAVELQGGTSPCATTPDSSIAPDENRPVSMFVAGD